MRGSNFLNKIPQDSITNQTHLHTRAHAPYFNLLIRFFYSLLPRLTESRIRPLRLFETQNPSDHLPSGLQDFLLLCTQSVPLKAFHCFSIQIYFNVGLFAINWRAIVPPPPKGAHQFYFCPYPTRTQGVELWEVPISLTTNFISSSSLQPRVTGEWRRLHTAELHRLESSHQILLTSSNQE